MQERIAKHLARLGLGSRRDVERWIGEGRIEVDGVRLTTPAFLLRGGEKIMLDGKAVAHKQPSRLWRYHKPRGLLTSHRDTHGRPTVFASLPKDLPRVISVGRLDLESEGLLLLTNDGELARKLELPSSGWERRYRVHAIGEITKTKLARLNRGMEISGMRYQAQARIEKRAADGVWLAMTLREGKKRQIRRMLSHLGLEVAQLIRLSHGPFRLGRLQAGELREVPRASLQRLQENNAHHRR